MTAKRTAKPAKRLSLYGLKPEDALRKAPSTLPPKQGKKAKKE